MRCPKCKSVNFLVIKTDSRYETFTFRYRKCKDCLVMWQTKELVVEGSAHKIDAEIINEDIDESEITNSVW